jgi:hypothetical protein
MVLKVKLFTSWLTQKLWEGHLEGTMNGFAAGVLIWVELVNESVGW